MKSNLKRIIKRFLGNYFYGKLRIIRPLIILIKNYYIDGKLFYKHSMVFNLDTFNKIESRIILHYHGLEKGFLFEDFKYRFGEFRVKELIKLLKYKVVVENYKKTQIAAAYLAMCKYYEKHQINEVDISDYYTYENYTYFKSLSTLDLEITKTHSNIHFFEKSMSHFSEFARSRSSVRNFTGEKISLDSIVKAIELAKTAPSVCNRQPVKVYYVDNKDKIDRIFNIQKGLGGFSHKVVQLLVLVSDRNYFYSIGERNQHYIDGGMFLMNLLYALHYFSIGACPAHWGLNYKEDKQIQKEIDLKDSEKVICLIPIGVPKGTFRTTLSLRRDNEEILIKVKNEPFKLSQVNEKLK